MDHFLDPILFFEAKEERGILTVWDKIWNFAGTLFSNE